MFTLSRSCCSNTWFHCDNIMVFQGQRSHCNEILWVKRKEKNYKERERERMLLNRHRRWRMQIQSCLSRPLRSVWLFFNAFTPALPPSNPSLSPFSLHLLCTNKGTSGLYPPPLNPPHSSNLLLLSDHFILHPNPCWLLCNPSLPPPALHPTSRLCSSLSSPLSSVSPSFLVAVSLW